jgi:hypothetical protein
VQPLQDLHAALLVGGQNQVALLRQGRGLDVEAADGLGDGGEVGVVAVQPVDALVRLEVSRVQDAPDGGAAGRLVGVLVGQAGSQLVKAPARRRAALPVR